MPRERENSGTGSRDGSPLIGQQGSLEGTRTPPPAGSGGFPWRRFGLNAFILWNLFAVGIWLLPNSVLRQSCAELVRPYLMLTGLAQGWTMFSPNPSDVDLYIEARITYANGQVRGWNYPRMIDMGYVERYRRERFRKMIEIANQDTSRMVWPSLARYAARRNNTDPRNRPVSVELVRHFRIVPPPGFPWGPYRTFVCFKTNISPEDLR
jgi:hypothetical protein